MQSTPIRHLAFIRFDKNEKKRVSFQKEALFVCQKIKNPFLIVFLALFLDVHKKITRKFDKRLDKTAEKW